MKSLQAIFVSVVVTVLALGSLAVAQDSAQESKATAP
jgi:hypothetical protein